MIMKKILLFSLLTCFAVFSYSQCNITGNTNGKMIYAENAIDTVIDGDSLRAIPVSPGLSIANVFQIKVPEDTVLVYNSSTYAATISNIVIDSIASGINHLAYDCNPSNCSFDGKIHVLPNSRSIET